MGTIIFARSRPAYDPVADTFAVVRLGEDGDVRLNELASKQRTWDGYSSEEVRGWRPENVKVRFPRRPQPTDGATPYYVKDITLLSQTGVETGSCVQLDDDMTALGATGTPTNAVALDARAQERADDWERKRKFYERPVLRVWEDFLPEATGLAGYAACRVMFDDRGSFQTAAVAERDWRLEQFKPLGDWPVWWPFTTGGGGGGSPLTTKGDIYTRNATVDTRLPVGSNGQVLTAASGATTGLAWVDADEVNNEIELTYPSTSNRIIVSGPPAEALDSAAYVVTQPTGVTSEQHGTTLTAAYPDAPFPGSAKVFSALHAHELEGSVFYPGDLGEKWIAGMTVTLPITTAPGGGTIGANAPNMYVELQGWKVHDDENESTQHPENSPYPTGRIFVDFGDDPNENIGLLFLHPQDPAVQGNYAGGGLHITPLGPVLTVSGEYNIFAASRVMAVMESVTEEFEPHAGGFAVYRNVDHMVWYGKTGTLATGEEVTCGIITELSGGGIDGGTF